MEGVINVPIAPSALESLLLMIFFFGGGNMLCNNVGCSAFAGLGVPGEAATPKAAQMSDEIF